MTLQVNIQYCRYTYYPLSRCINAESQQDSRAIGQPHNYNGPSAGSQISQNQKTGHHDHRLPIQQHVHHQVRVGYVGYVPVLQEMVTSLTGAQDLCLIGQIRMSIYVHDGKISVGPLYVHQQIRQSLFGEPFMMGRSLKGSPNHTW